MITPNIRQFKGKVYKPTFFTSWLTRKSRSQKLEVRTGYNQSSVWICINNVLANSIGLSGLPCICYKVHKNFISFVFMYEVNQFQGWLMADGSKAMSKVIIRMWNGVS